ncbi:5989_t:CDS:2 [Scutellospora calospora]|uniref:5989_t:CDS:1 n=1 Tax=Scutellospora calospora TaxID=85575 RepID=A0ACA9JV71_9GLOM|nr:5989_t:CDS:2 [Scutellospora calospora]
MAEEEKYALDLNFKRNLFGRSGLKENTYEKFIKTYIDKTIGSEIAIEQIIGRVLRQPNCQYYKEEKLNKAYFHIRVDEDQVFQKRSKYPESYMQNIGQRQWTEYELGIQITQPEIRQEAFGLTNMVPARAEKELCKVGEELITTYLKESSLKVNLDDPYQVKGLRVRKKSGKEFNNALHSQYNGSDLNNLERRVAEVLDDLGIDWCRNPTYYETVVCLEVTGEHLEKDKLKRKLVHVREAEEETTEQAPQKVRVIILIQYGNPKENEEIYYKVWYKARRSGEAKSVRVENIGEGLKIILGDL